MLSLTLSAFFFPCSISAAAWKPLLRQVIEVSPLINRVIMTRRASRYLLLSSIEIVSCPVEIKRLERWLLLASAVLSLPPYIF